MWKSISGINFCNHTKHQLVKRTSKQSLQRYIHPRSQLRLYSSEASSSGGSGRVVLGILGGTVLITGGSIAYAKYDPKFRDTLENNIPYSNVVLRSILGEPEPKIPPTVFKRPTPENIKAKPKQQSQTELQKKEPEPEIASKKVEPKQTKPISTSIPVAAAVPAAVVTTSVESAKSTPVKPAEDPKPVAPESIKSNTLQKESTVEEDSESTAANEVLKEMVDQSVSNLQSAIDEALLAYGNATNSIRDHTHHIELALEAAETSDESAWKNLSEALKIRKSGLLEAEAKGVRARVSLQKVQQIVAEGKRSKITSSNPSLVSAEEAVNKAVYQLQNAESEVMNAQSESNVISEYKNVVEKARQDFQNELKAIMPDFKITPTGQKLSEEEMNYLIAHAHRRVKQFQSQLKQQQGEELRHVQQALDAQRKEFDKLSSNRATIELDKQHRELEILYQQKLMDLSEEFEMELRQQLRRQAAAHTDHIQDVVQTQERELQRKFERIIEDRVGEARTSFQQELAASLGRLKAIEESIAVRAELDKENRRSQRLWLACLALHQSIKSGRSEAKSWEEQLKPLDLEVATIRNAAGEGDAFTNSVITSFPTEALSRGVFTEDAIKDRFVQVVRQCRRVAMIGEEGGSLMRYAVSYIQSLLIVNEPRLSAAEIRDEPVVDPESLSTFDILSRAQWHVERDNLEQALRYMNLLRGAPHHVAKDWLAETRILLETRQAATALLARAAATNVQTNQA